MATRPTLLLLATALFCSPLTVEGQQSAGSQGTPPSSQTTAPAAPQSTAPTSQPSTLDDTLKAGDDEVRNPSRKLIDWNEYRWATFFAPASGLAFCTSTQPSPRTKTARNSSRCTRSRRPGISVSF